MSVISSNKKDSSVSSVIGTIVLLALVVTSTAVIAGTVISNINDNAQVGSIISFEASADPYRLYHAGGDPIQLSQIYILYTDKEGYSREITKFSKIIEGGKEPQYIMSDDSLAVEIWNTGEALAPYYMNNEVNVSEILIVSTLGGRTTEIYKGSDYVVGIIPFGPGDIHTVTTTLTGFRTTSNINEIGTNIIFDTNSRIGVIVELSGDGTSYVSGHPSVFITNPNIGSLTFWKTLPDNKYLYFIEKTNETSNYYRNGITDAQVSGTVSFNDGVSPVISFSGSVNIPPEADLTFKVGTYAKYLTGAYGGDKVNNYYVGHGITVEITGGSRASEVVPIYSASGDDRLDYRVEVTLKENEHTNEILKTGENKNDKNKPLIEDDGISTGIIKYYYIKNENKYRFPFDAAEYKISIKFSDTTTKDYTFNSNNELVSSIIEYHIPAWSPLYEDLWYKQPDTELKPFDTEIKTYVSGDGEIADRGIIVCVNNGYFPDKLFKENRFSDTDSVYPVKIESVILKDGANTINLSAKDADAVKSINNNIDYYFSLSSFKNGESIENAIVNVTFTMQEMINNDPDVVKSRSYKYTKDGIDIGGIDLEDDYIKVKVEGYQKFVEYLNNGLSDIANNSRGHGLKFTVELNNTNMIPKGSRYYLDVSFSNGDTEYELSDTNLNKYLLNRLVFEDKISNTTNSNLRNLMIEEIGTSKILMQITNTKDSHQLFGDGKYYYYIMPSNQIYSNSAFDNPNLKVDLYVSTDGGITAKRIKTIFDTTDSTKTDDISVPARDVLVKDLSIKGYCSNINGDIKRGIHVMTTANLNKIGDLSVGYNVGSLTVPASSVTLTKLSEDGKADIYYGDYPIVGKDPGNDKATNVVVSVGGANVPIYKGITDDTVVTEVTLPTQKIVINDLSTNDRLSGTGTITASIKDMNNNIVQNNVDVIWSSSDESKLTIDSTGKYTVKVDSGEEVTITAVLSSNPLYSASVTVKCGGGLPDGHIEDTNGNEYTISNYKGKWGTFVNSSESLDQTITRGDVFKDGDDDYWVSVIPTAFNPIKIEKSGDKLTVKKKVGNPEDIYSYNTPGDLNKNNNNATFFFNIGKEMTISTSGPYNRGAIYSDGKSLYICWADKSDYFNDVFWVKFAE